MIKALFFFFQEKLRKDNNNDNVIVLALMLYSDATLLSGKGNVSGWPIVMSLANIPLNERRKVGKYKLMGLIPKLDGNFDSTAKVDFFNKCLDTILQPLKKLSYTGLKYKGSVLFPFLYAYVHDYPEGCKVKFISNL